MNKVGLEISDWMDRLKLNELSLFLINNRFQNMKSFNNENYLFVKNLPTVFLSEHLPISNLDVEDQNSPFFESLALKKNKHSC